MRNFVKSGSLVMMVVLSFGAARAQFIQQGSKLVGTGAAGDSSSVSQGSAVSISADGNTALVGGYIDNNETGAAWVFTRSGGVWSQQGSKLVGTGAAGLARQAVSVALSGDGNTAIIGGILDSNSVGAVWVFTRSGSVWSQQGRKLVGSGGIGRSEQGDAVALSFDGNTALVGGNFDDSLRGAAWVFTRTSDVWTQQGIKLVGAGASRQALQGISVSLSSDGNTALIGGYADSGEVGAAWVFTRTGSAWSQQGRKLVGTGAIGPARQGMSVGLSGDGNTAVVGGYADDTLAGAVWIFTRSGSVWSQQGSKLVGTGAVNNGVPSFQGYSVSTSSDGNAVIMGGYPDNGFTGAAWVFTRAGGLWSQLGGKLVGTGASGNSEQGVSVAISSDGNTALVGGFADNNFMGAAWVFARTVSGIRNPAGEEPAGYSLAQNYPNPFNPTTTISFAVPSAARVRLSVFDILGRELSVLIDERKEAGIHEFIFDGTGLASGVYFYRLQAGDFVSTKRLLLLR